jgi:hypothetical protein
MVQSGKTSEELRRGVRCAVSLNGRYIQKANRLQRKLPWQLEQLSDDARAFSYAVALAQEILGMKPDGVMTDSVRNRIALITSKKPVLELELHGLSELARAVMIAAVHHAVDLDRGSLLPVEELSAEWAWRCIEYGAGSAGVRSGASGQGMAALAWFRRCLRLGLAVTRERAAWGVKGLSPEVGDVVALDRNDVDKLKDNCYAGIVVGVTANLMRIIVPMREKGLWRHAVIIRPLDAGDFIGFIRSEGVVCG